MNKKLNILFLCTGNSCRSQMAEGWTNHLKGDVINCRSAGTETHGLNPMAVKAMVEAGVDISHHKFQLVDDFLGGKWDFMNTVRGNAHETCPMFPGRVKIVHAEFDDPPTLSKEESTEKGAMTQDRKVRDEIRAFVESLPEFLLK
jgi:arsenate reductase